MKKISKTSLITILIITLISVCIFYGRVQRVKNKPVEDEVNENVTADGKMKIGFGISTYVSPFDATSIEEGRLQDGIVFIDSSYAALVVDGSLHIAYAYIDDIESSAWFNHEGLIGTDKDIKIWPSKKESDQTFYQEMTAFEQAIIGMNQDDFNRFIDSLSQEEYPSLQYNEIKNAVNNAFIKLEAVSSVKSVGTGTITRFELDDASEENTGTIKVISSFVLIASSESEKITHAFLDEVETVAEFDRYGKVITNRFDTRSKVEKSLDGKIEEISDIPEYYIKDLQTIINYLNDKTLEEVANFNNVVVLLDELQVFYEDLLEAFIKAYDNLSPWY